MVVFWSCSLLNVALRNWGCTVGYSCGLTALRGRTARFQGTAVRRGALRRMTSIIGIFTCLGAVASAQTDSCSCPTATTPVYRNFGGDSRPLRWVFEAYEKGRLICFVKNVENKSMADVTDVYWEVAHYERDVMAPHSDRPSCV